MERNGLSNLIDSHLRNIPVKLFLFIAHAAILFNKAELFEQFW